jgi:hypothetical protein
VQDSFVGASVEVTTINDIVDARRDHRNVLFHFGYEKDILLELGRGTSEALTAEAVHGAAPGRSSSVPSRPAVKAS